MQKEDRHIKYIRAAFTELQTKDDLLVLLNYAKQVVYNDKSYPFTLQQLTWFSHPAINKRRYQSFEIPKKNSNQVRVINAPVRGLLSLQKTLAFIFQCVFEPHRAAMGFTAGKSVVDNAKLHTGNWYVYNIDLKDFFSSIDQARIWKCFQIPPFNLQSPQIANILAAICCTEVEVERMNHKGQWEKMDRYVLPQGAPTSPILSNVVCQRLDYLLTAVAKKFGAKYSRYADDITFSSLHDIYQTDGAFIKELSRIILQQNFHIKEGKTRLQKQGYRQEVTGLIINEKVNVSKRYIQQLRKWLYYWERYGYERANNYFEEYFRKDKPWFHVPELRDVVRGKLNFLSMVRGMKDPLVQKLWNRFKSLALKPASVNQQVDMKAIVDQVAYMDPKETMRFLKGFKYDNQFSFKSLVHRPADSMHFDFVELLKKAQKEFEDVSLTYNDKLNLPKTLFDAMGKFFQHLETEGVQYYKKTREHPIDEPKTGRFIQQFKRNYRFGNEKSESSILSDILINTAKKRKYIFHSENIIYSFGEGDTSRLFRASQLKFLPDIDKFQARANFFTWVPNVIIAFAATFDSILKHSNLKGKRPFVAYKKQILIDINRRVEGEDIVVELSILDKDSLFKGNIDSLLHDLRKDYYASLKGIADIRVEFDNKNDGKAYVCRVFPFSKKVEPIAKSPGGFKYVFTFYD